MEMRAPPAGLPAELDRLAVCVIVHCMGFISELNFDVGINGLTSGQAMLWGFRSGDRGTHTSRTIMLDELSHLLEAVPGKATREEYADAVVEHNCLRKRTAATRKLSLQRLTELYALDSKVILFRILRLLWSSNENSRPLLALLLALARDPLLRATATAVIRTPYGHEFARQPMKDALSNAVADRMNDAQPWTKLCATPWAAILDASPDDLIDVAVDAKRLGLLDLKQSGLITDVSFPALLKEKERELIHGAHRQAG
jgi:hypothetical protein